MFLGCMAACTNTLSPTAIQNHNSDLLTIKNAIWDELYVSNKIEDNFNGSVPDEWTFDTRLHAKFEENLYGGNVNFTEEIVESIRIKKRTSKDSRFQTIYEKEIHSNEDFSIELLDYYEPVGNVDYAYVPVISGGENNYITNSVESKFDSYFLVEKGVSYPLILDVTPTQSVVYESNTVKPLGRKYPITIVNGNTGYYTGNIECLFIELDKDGLPKTVSSPEYREQIHTMLSNSKPKLLKDYDGNLRLVMVNGDISESEHKHLLHTNGRFTHVLSSFSWVESGDAYDAMDLYYNGFIDTSLG